ncbi:MAG: hypothetical protein ACLF0G_15010 [Candidatus Brocadiia bacterium]
MLRRPAFALAVLLAGAAAWGDSPHMLGRQSHNIGIPVVPAPGEVAIDGELEDWDFSGRIWCFADKAVRDRYSARVAAMWDERHLYLAARWNDPTPMFSRIDPRFNPADGWKSDSWQLRVRTDRTLWVTTWYFTPRKQPVMHLAYWKKEGDSRAGQDVVVLAAEPGGTELGRGAAMAYRKRPDERGTTQELRIPWKLLFRQVPPVEPGLVFKLGMEFLWGDVTGETWPVHRYADNMQPGHTSREFFWTAVRAWGDARLVAEGGLEPRRYVVEEELLEGTVPVRAVVPADARRFTLVIEGPDGKRVRNLAADFDPRDYAVALDGPRRTVEVMWDCLDDWGQLVAPGSYAVRGLSHRGLRASYEMTFYNPGTPPWQTADGSGGWGADHAPPLRVARAGDMMVLSWAFAEGGSGIVGIGPDGLKKWGEKRGARYLAADQAYLYAVPAGWHVEEEVLIRMRAEDGSYAPFVLDGQERPFELPVADIFGGEPPGQVAAIAAHAGRLVLAMSEGGLALLDAQSAVVRKAIEAPRPSALAFGPEGTLYAVLDGALHRVDLDRGRLTALRARGLGEAGPIAVDLEGRLLVADKGPDRQVKAYRRARTLLGRSGTRLVTAYTCGRKGGRPIRGAFDGQAMSHVSSIAVDAQGHVWAVESWDYPRRVAVWDREGKLVRDYIGNTGYAGTGCFLHESDPTLGYCGPIEMKLDKGDRSWEVTQVLWVPDRERGETFPVAMGAALPQRFRSDASGTAREYLFHHPYDAQSGNVVYMRREGGWQPVAAVCYVGHISGRITHHSIVEEEPSGEFAGLDAYDGAFWSDANGDGRPQRTECTIVPAKQKTDERQRRGEGPFPLRSGWGGRISPSDLVFYTDGIHRFKPLRFTDHGAPVYGPEGMEKLPLDERGDLVPVPQEHLLLCLSFKGYGGRTTGMLGVDDRSGEVLWSYPNLYPGVHGSHRAPMPRPGLLIGPLKICGVARVDQRVGRVFVLRGNLGQDFFMTTDGLFVGAMFRDCRLPAEPLPPSEEALAGMAMEGLSNGGEPFNGWFGRQADGGLRMTTGMARQACMVLQVGGLETIRRFEAQPIEVDNATLVKANRENIARAAEAAEPKSLAVARMARPPAIDGDLGDWRGLRPIRIQRQGSPNRADVRVAYDEAHLYLAFHVRDPSPWLNQGKDPTRLFKTGDACDLHLCTDPQAEPERQKLLPSDVRVLFASLGGEPAAVLMKPVDPGAPEAKRVRYHSPVADKRFDRVDVLDAASVAVKKTDEGYTLEAAVPLEAIGLEARPGMSLRGDLGFISSDAQGRTNVARTYWANRHTNLVSDLPHEAWLYPARWGEMTFE